MCSSDVFLGVLAILFPPLPVWVKRGICSADSMINILLCVLGFIPGLLHAWYIIAKFPDDYDHDYERVPQDHERGNRVTYVYVEPGRQPKPHGQPASGQPNYGTASNSSHHQQGVTSNGEGSAKDQSTPPSYADVVAGDNKVQTHD
ncbi:hypothetical protein N3K66_007680 [Trichothecium roseum]|uniref:Uncharacterized protein n=1 Tax=Trichothecium roseum TaxID=47278 RepID=A0ACC0UWE5_9HYPO|nr:hypothetical protein N3K66_007680 [Trichothecium roseum]